MDIYKDCINKQFVFVQHGVIMNDVRQYHNRELITADLFITTTKDEYNYMIQPDLSYEEGMVVLFTDYQKVTKGTTTEEISIQIRGCSKEEIILKSYNPTKTIAEIIDIYNEILNSDYVTEEMLNNNYLMAEEIWQRMR